MEEQKLVSDFNLWENKNQIKKKLFWKRFYFLKIFLIIIAVSSGLAYVVFLLRPVIILDSESYLPISGASVKYEYVGRYIGSGCSEEKIHNSSYGLTMFPLLILPCGVKVTKYGYHINGAARMSDLPGLLGLKVVVLKKIKTPQPLIKFKRIFSANTGMDVTSYLSNPDSKLISERMIDDIKNDFTFLSTGLGYDTYIINGRESKSSNGNPVFRIKFNSDGGVQEIIKDKSRQSGAENNYLFENLLLAPESGYKKEMDIISDKAYVARLQDGKHYMMFSISEDIIKGNYWLTAYVQPREIRNLESIDSIN